MSFEKSPNLVTLQEWEANKCEASILSSGQYCKAYTMVINDVIFKRT